jgi:hypothetical protein
MDMNKGIPDLPKISQPEIESLDDEHLQQHFLRMQQALIQAVDQELHDMGAKLTETQMDLKNAQEDKTAVGMALYQANSKIGRMNQQLEIL